MKNAFKARKMGKTSRGHPASEWNQQPPGLMSAAHGVPLFLAGMARGTPAFASTWSNILQRAEEEQRDQFQMQNRFGQPVSLKKMGITAGGELTKGAKLLRIIELTAREFPLRVRLFSAHRGKKGAHGEGLAVDVQIFDEAGKPIASYQTPQTANIYALFALKAREIQKKYFSELNDYFVWGGGWRGMKKGGGGGRYGAADWMHFEVRSPQRLRVKKTMSVFSWKDGWLEGATNYREGCFLKLGEQDQPNLEKHLKFLEGFRLTENDIKEQEKIAKMPKKKKDWFESGLLGHENIGERKTPLPDIRLEFDPSPYFRPPERLPKRLPIPFLIMLTMPRYLWQTYLVSGGHDSRLY
ncbi:hypothetical protein ACHHRT_01110 [Desulfurivibrio sp. D14AmB]|uniref:hypothetical protein n=1 Tax=Desulfurivibrio sp. D14AmB TaxID=3374370 RepID=UPI00376F0FEB